jgi:hypothetical protein
VRSEKPKDVTKQMLAKGKSFLPFYRAGYKAGLDAAIEAATKATPRAHTYASENADIYRAWDDGAETAINAIKAIREMKQKGRP